MQIMMFHMLHRKSYARTFHARSLLLTKETTFSGDVLAVVLPETKTRNNNCKGHTYMNVPTYVSEDLIG